MDTMLFIRGARKLVNMCAKVQPGEKVLVVGDFGTARVAEIIATAALEVTDDVVVTLMPPREVDGSDPPEAVGAAMSAADVVFTPVSASITHSATVQNMLARGGRHVSFVGCAPANLVRGGIDADFHSLRHHCEQVADLFTAASCIRLMTPGGTDLTCCIQGRNGNAHYCIADSAGKGASVPNVEANVSPVEDTANGVIVADASIPYFGFGVLTEPVLFRVESGRITAIEGGGCASYISELMRKLDDPKVYNIAQVALGLNPYCVLQGRALEDEGVVNTAHIGIGTSTVLGGKILTKLHFDVLMWKPDVFFDGVLRFSQGAIVEPDR